MTDDPLYRREMLRLAADATGAGTLPAPDGVGDAHNPVCGDRVTVTLALAAGRVTALAHQTHACILTQASAALLAGAAPGQSPATLTGLADRVRAWLADGGEAPPGYAVFDGVTPHAGRHRCVLLPLEAALAALKQAQEAAEGPQRQAGSI
ncbi:MAG TPA: iron-sulfur cluster assembly scaffold protein [Rhizomicrobium sp.]|jgi:NifU-like protein involved in Fe-S cluster formation|nr:iron-sulfur cluster assembly scaffold protein [Rhizomicrobium sp.]